jgi:PAS domain-containing protein
MGTLCENLMSRLPTARPGPTIAMLEIGLGPLDALSANADTSDFRAALDATRVLEADQGAAELAGCTRDEVLSRSFGHWWPAAALPDLTSIAADRQTFAPFAQTRTVMTQFTGAELDVQLGACFQRGSAVIVLVRTRCEGSRLRKLDHEASQPLAAIAANAGAAVRWLRRDGPNLSEALAALERILQQGERAAAILKGATRP